MSEKRVSELRIYTIVAISFISILFGAMILRVSNNILSARRTCELIEKQLSDVIIEGNFDKEQLSDVLQDMTVMTGIDIHIVEKQSSITAMQLK